MREKRFPFILVASTALVLFGILLALLYQRDPVPKEPVTVADAAAEITAGYDTTEEKTMAIYRYLTRNFQYDSELRDAVLSKEITKHTPDSQQTLNARKGTCCDLAELCAAMLESQRIEAKIINGYYNGVYHAWNSIYDEKTGKWMQIDVTSDLWYGRLRTEWPEFEAARYTDSVIADDSAPAPITLGASN